MFGQLTGGFVVPQKGATSIPGRGLASVIQNVYSVKAHLDNLN